MARSAFAAARSSGGRLRGLAALSMLCVALSSLSIRDREDDRPFAAAVARGALIVAVPSRPAPTLNVGKVDRFARVPDGFAAALAQDIGRRVGLPVTFVLAGSRDVSDATKADIAITGHGFADDRALAYAPTAYASGHGMALVLRHGTVQAWRDLAGGTVCASRGSPFARDAARRARANVREYDRPLDALLAFQAGECAALVDDELAIRKLLKQPDWAYYRSLPGTLDPAPAYIAARGGDIEGAAFIERTVQDWRRQRWLSTVREDQATQLAFEMFNAQNDLYCH
ncbi:MULTISPECIES: transporter substrate-binding domain-containing protein [unclassified Caballeronia]|uniref:transporter substrate-binding domain-containing protein n=1 Tax=unclassified Caballeronia TaxID=2646786 RepID=UPI001F484B08|nr:MULTISPECIES: transporter substrate-binding domain-containing protein [unclassified Caballeronia]MCE4546200.1 transporter substrate-binding domain-containing protein [Caballeronia sp. PC1]MCE4573325.1 transporter substrate-binding domain-containing protein [Caballeronia sp. CLC5]